ncbi:hypothetical protein NE237_002451 [Protea cynaroides]|uniref:Tyrosinase copper-binding domain-containing protein n=1 Tax=Protea cynaroides TaxID=273540 RepID=A0A9Q0KV77_9MAGN|nr:hypothetical protein NE237_002451 [Protea cynaroides]
MASMILSSYPRPKGNTFPHRKKLQSPVVGNRRYLLSSRKQVSCKANSYENEERSLGRLERRDVLIGLGGLAGSTSLSADPLALAAPIQAPDFSKCGPAKLLSTGEVISSNCCPPVDLTILDYKLRPAPNKLRVRPAAHLVTDEYLTKYKKAVSLMKALPDDDPRSFSRQANVHCAYCNGAFDQVGYTDLVLQVHFCWLFFPFHRWYLYFYERILGKLIDDPTFTLPFWNYDSPPGMQIPAIFTDTSSSIYNSLRNPNHQPPTVMDLNWSGTDSTTTSNDDLIAANLKTMYRQVAAVKKANLFLGEAYRAGDASSPGQGTVEAVPHNIIHAWTGDPNQPNGEDMGNFYSAGRDSIFYCHHANVDRLWTIWTGLGGTRKNPTDTDWLDAAFLFYDENKQLVRVKVRDCVDEKKLGYTYQEVPIPWLKTPPVPRKPKFTPPASASSVTFPRVLDSVVQVVVTRPKKSRTKKQKEDEEEVLVVDGIKLENDEFVKFDVFINDDDPTASGPDKTEFAGSFVHIPHMESDGKKKKKKKDSLGTILRIGISELLDEVGADDDDSVAVTHLFSKTHLFDPDLKHRQPARFSVLWVDRFFSDTVYIFRFKNVISSWENSSLQVSKHLL